MSTGSAASRPSIATGAHAAEAVHFDAPGPGAWMRDRVHVPRPWSRYQQEIHPPALAHGFRAASRRYGWPVDRLEYRFVHGFGYLCAQPVDPALLPDRLAAAERALATRLWREDADRWQRVVKPAAVHAHLALQATDPAALSPDGLLAHLERCRKHQRAMIVQHNAFAGAALGPVGDLLAHAVDWTGIDSSRIAALARTAPRAPGPLDRLASALGADRRALAVLNADAPAGETLTRLRRQPGEAGRLVAAYLDSVGHRLLDSLDVGDPCVLEAPELVVRRLRQALEHPGRERDHGPSAHEVERVREQVPAARRDEFDALLAEARLTACVRRERAGLSDVWAGGLVRRAILTAGESLAAAGRIERGEHLVEAGHAELRALIEGRGGPSADELARRARTRAEHRSLETPGALGDLPPGGRPLAALRAVRALYTAMAAVLCEAETASDRATVRGIAAAPGTYTGTARVVRGPRELVRLRLADVLVTISTSDSLDTVMPLLGALVTDAGGVLSHAAAVSRDHGIPGVVGTGDATALIHDGTLVRVRGDTGEVEVLG